MSEKISQDKTLREEKKTSSNKGAAIITRHRHQDQNDDEDEEQIKNIYSRFVFEDKPKKNVNFNEDVRVKMMTVTSDNAQTEENSAMGSHNEEFKHAKDKEYAKIINCRTQAQVKEVKAQLLSQIDILNGKKAKNFNVSEEIKRLQSNIHLLLATEQKLIDEEKELKQEQKLQRQTSADHKNKILKQKEEKIVRHVNSDNINKISEQKHQLIEKHYNATSNMQKQFQNVKENRQLEAAAFPQQHKQNAELAAPVVRHSKDISHRLFEQVYGEKKIRILIYFDVLCSTSKKSDFHQNLCEFLKNSPSLKDKIISVSLICEYESKQFRYYELEKSKTTYFSGRDIYECLFDLEWKENNLNIIVHVKSNHYRNMRLFESSNIKQDYLSYFKQVGIVVFDVVSDYIYLDNSLPSVKQFKKLGNFKFSIEYLNELLNDKILKEIIDFRKKMFSIGQLFTLKRIPVNSSDLILFESNRLSSLNNNQFKISSNVHLIIPLDGNYQINPSSINYTDKSQLIEAIPSRTLYEFRSSRIFTPYDTYYWLEPIENMDVLTDFENIYSITKIYVDKYNARNPEYIKLKISEMFRIQNHNRDIFFGNMTNKEIRKSKLFLDIDDDAELKNSFMKAFTHFTYEESKQELIIKDLRTLVFDHSVNFIKKIIRTFSYRSRQIECILITEPIVFSAKDANKYSSANLSNKGISDFVNKHKCSEHCSKIGLTPFR